MRADVALRVMTALLVLAGWLVVVRGLYVIPVSTDPKLDLEAGPGFGVAVGVYIPSLALTLVLIALLAVGAMTRLSALLVAAAATAGAFAWWVLTQSALLAYRPGLDDHLRWSFIISGTALLLACLCLVASRQGGGGGDVAARADRRVGSKQ